jgi:predicted RecB family nuclease
VHLSDGTIVLSPSDLTAFLACDHRSALDRQVAEGTLARPVQDDPELEILRRRGDEHEKAELERLIAEGRHVVTIDCDGSSPEALLRAEAETVQAVRDGAEVIFQATFFDGRWRGHADFLLRVEVPSPNLGAWSYEVADTKLARRAKPAAIIQLCNYAEHVARVQGSWPEEVEVVTGDGERHRHKVSDAIAYYRSAKARLEAFVDGPPVEGTYPHPNAHCQVCPWDEPCVQRRRADDHLSVVAGMRRDMAVKLGRVGVSSVTGLAASTVGDPVPGMGQATIDRLRHQARLQLEQRGAADGEIRWELLPPDGARRGLAALPPPSAGDLFFDIEGDPWAGDGGLEYLFGLTEVDGTYHAFWAHDPAQEKRAFEQLVDLLIERLDRDPGMHVYHYAPYEETALKKLAGRYATREAEVDRLLRGDVLVDLYRVVRQGVRAGTEGYGLKKLEPLYLDARGGEIKDGGSSIVAYEDWIESRDDALLESIRAYNEIDCLSTAGLRDWLEARRADLVAAEGEDAVPRPEVADGQAPETVAEADAKVEELTLALLDGIPVDPAERDGDQQGRWLLAQLLGWHRREARPEWWAWFDRLERSDEELVNDAECLGEIAFVEEVADLARSAVFRYSFDPAQEHKFSVGDEPIDPRTKKRAGEVVAVDQGAGTIDLKRGRAGGWAHPTALIPRGPIDSKPLRLAVERLAQAVVADPSGDPPARRAILDLLRRRPPRVFGHEAGESLQFLDETGSDAARRLVPELLGATLAVQGPPGSGKTWTAAAVVVDAVRRGKRVGVTAQSHKAIGNVLEAIASRAAAEGVEVRIVQKATEDQRCTAPSVRCTNSNEEIVEALQLQAVDVVGGTSWLFAREDLDGVLDLLVVDEAGQLSLANVAAVSGAATDLVLFGDPQQLAQVSKGTHPPGAGVSALEHVLEGEPTVPPTRGVFLDRSHRMHPDVCAFVSTIAYDDRLRSVPECAGQAVGEGGLVAGAGLRWLPVEHEGNRTRAAEEAAAVGKLVQSLLGQTFVDRNGQQKWLEIEDVLVIAAYNAQVAELTDALPVGARVGTVDRFQGQEAPVVVYSLAASSAEDVPRGLDFLLSVNRLNVAVSRAQALAVLVGSPALLRAPCRTVKQLRLVNALCRFVEDAAEVEL